MNRLLLSVFLLLLSLGFVRADDIDLNNGLIGYWPLNGNALDYSCNGNDGTLLPNAHFINNPDGGGQVLQTVNGNTQEGYVLVNLPSSLYPVNIASGYEGSGSLWVRFDDENPIPSQSQPLRFGIINNPPGIRYLSRDNYTGAILTQVKSEDENYAHPNAFPRSSPNSADQIGVWYHIAWTLHSHGYGEEGFLRFYINGQLDSEYTEPALPFSTSDFLIGTWYEEIAPNQKFAEVRLYDRILTEDEIAALANPNAMNGENVGFAWNSSGYSSVSAPSSVDPEDLGLALLDAYGVPLSSYEDSSRIPDLYYTIISGPAIHNANGQIEFLGGGDVVLKLETPGNEYYAATTEEITISASGTTFNNTLWSNETGTGFFITDNAEAGVATLGDEAVRVSADGNVGIGVTQPQAALDVSGNTQVSGSLQAANGLVKVTESGDLVINEGQVNEIRLGADGSAHFPKYGDIKMLGEE